MAQQAKSECVICGDFSERIFFSRTARQLFRDQCAKRGVHELDIAIAAGFDKEWYERWMLGDPRKRYMPVRRQRILGQFKEMLRMVGVEIKVNFVITDKQ